MAGTVILLNGAPRSGKSTIAAEIVATFPGAWVNLGVDQWVENTPAEMLPGIGLRPGGERPDLESYVSTSYRDLFARVAMIAAEDVGVAVDVGLHDAYSSPLGIRDAALERFARLRVVLVGVRCGVAEVARRRAASAAGNYVAWNDDGSIAQPVLDWEVEVHRAGGYDVEVDTSEATATECAAQIRRFIEDS